MSLDVNRICKTFNEKLNSNKCPTNGSLGECPVVTPIEGHNGYDLGLVTIYWWKKPPSVETLIGWVNEIGLHCCHISVVLYSDDGTTADDNKDVIMWEVTVCDKVDGRKQPTEQNYQGFVGILNGG